MGKCSICKEKTNDLYECKECGQLFCKECGNPQTRYCVDCKEYETHEMRHELESDIISDLQEIEQENIEEGGD